MKHGTYVRMELEMEARMNEGKGRAHRSWRSTMDRLGGFVNRWKKFEYRVSELVCRGISI